MAGVGRKRKTNRHLPERVYFRRGAHYYVHPDGKWERLAVSYSDALVKLAGIKATDGPTDTIEQLCARYGVEELAGKAEETRKGRLQAFKPLLKVFGHMSAEEIEPHDVWNYWKARGTNTGARGEIKALSALLTFARRIGARKQPNPCFGLQLPRAKARDRYVPDDEFLLVRGVAQPMIAHAMDLALVAGMDGATIRRLERRHITDEGIQFERGKTGKLQLIEWNDELHLIVQAILRERPQLRRFLICNRKGQPYSRHGFQSQWQRTMRNAAKAGLQQRFNFHDLRAKSASDEKDDQTAADRLGHGDVKLTREVYRRLPRRAAALSILDKPGFIGQSPKK